MHLGSIGVHGTDTMQAVAQSHDGHNWVTLGEMRHGRVEPVINLHFYGQDALAKSIRLADAINAAMADDRAPALAAE